MGDKSISHRFAMLAPLAKGVSCARNLLMSDDVLSTISCMEAMGCCYNLDGDTVTVQGGNPLHSPTIPLQAGNSGTTMRLLAGLLCGQGVGATILGDASLSSRPMERIVTPLRQMGCNISAQDGKAPLTIAPSAPHGIAYVLPVQSAQLKSAVLLCGLGATEPTTVRFTDPMRDHTERMLAAMGADITCHADHTVLTPGPQLEPINLFVPGDTSSAAYFIAGALLLPGSQLVIQDVGINPTRMGFVRVLQKMGANIAISNVKNQFEPYGDITVKYSDLTNITVEQWEIPSLIDEIPLLAVVAAFGNGTMKICGASELRHKESDRFSALVTQLGHAGADIRAQGDDLVICGTGGLIGGTFDSLGDHRLAMAFYVAALAAKQPSTIAGADCISVSFPQFYSTMKSVEVPR